MINNAIKTVFAALVLILLGFIAFTLFQDKYLKAGKDLVVEETPVADFVVIETIEAIGRIELVRYKLTDAVIYENKAAKESFFTPQQKILMVIAGEAVGCIDFTKIRKEDVVVRKDSVVVMLPQPELCYYKLDQQNCKVFDITMTQIFDKTSLVDAAYKKAELRVRDMAMNSKILEETKKNAESMLRPLLENLTGKRVILVFPSKSENKELEVID